MNGLASKESLHLQTEVSFMKIKIAYGLLILGAMLLFSADADAQCAMCKTAAESSLESGSSAAAGINKGVLYLFLTPYVVGGTIAFFWWRARKRAAQGN